MSDGSNVITLLNEYNLWRLETYQMRGNKFIPEEADKIYFKFEVWLNSEEERSTLFDELKSFVDQYGGVIDWHLCTHDEEYKTPCEIAEEYRKE